MSSEPDAASILANIWRSLPSEPSVYDEVLREVSKRAQDRRSIGKADIGALVVWKRLNASTRWATDLMLTPDATVRDVTAVAWAQANDLSVPIPEAGGAARQTLWSLPGFGGTGAIASAVLVALSPTRMAVWDRRVRSALDALGRRPESGDGQYERYLEIALNLAQSIQTATGAATAPTPREVDLVLFRAGGDAETVALLKQTSTPSSSL